MKRFSCEVLVDVVTAYLDHELAEPDRDRFEDHLRACEGCARYVGQFRATVGALGELPPQETLSAPTRHRLLAAFRASRRTRS
ncbi:zf-HC2 domain-containing protein [Streptosporangium soli]|nr:anti-sigma factor [Streptosporangium sp. KLBMP 9127]